MKFSVLKSDIVTLLAKTQNIVEKRNTMPVLVNNLLSVEKGLLKIYATDLEVSLTDQIEVQNSEDGKIAVDAKSLFQIVKELPEGSIDFIKKENNWLTIKQGKSVFSIVGIPADEYPVFPSYTSDVFLKIQADVFSDMIEKTIYSVSTDETRYHLNGVFLTLFKEGGKPRYRMVATDGHRLSLVDRAMENGKETAEVIKNGVIIPRKGIQEIRKILDSAKGDSVEMIIEGAQLIVRYGTTLLMIRLIEGKYPNYEQLIPHNVKNSLSVSRDNLMSSLKRVSLLSNQKSKGVTLSIKGGCLEITSNNPELGEAKEELEVEYKGPDIKIGFNARYLLDILNSFEDDSVNIRLNDNLSPGVIRPDSDNDYTCIVMPMRI